MSLRGTGDALDVSWCRPRRALALLGVVFCLAFLSLAGRLVYIQVASHEILSGLAEKQQSAHVDVYPCRGAVVDASGRPMATTIETYSIFADPKLIYDKQYCQWQVAAADVESPARDAHAILARSQTAGLLASRGPAVRSADSPGAPCCSAAARKLAGALAMDAEEIERLIEENANGHFVWLKRRVDQPTRDAVRALKVPGIGIRPEGTRHYPGGQLAAHVLGTVGVENQGVDGLEYLLDGQLSGSRGHRVVRVDGKRRPIWIRPEDYHPSSDGRLLVLTIDLTIQMFAEQALRDTVERFGARGGAAVVMDPLTGDILALANCPSFDPQHYTEARDYDRRNRALTDPYEPGSTFKCFVAAAALEEGVVRPGERIFCHNGLHYVRGRRLKDVHPYGWLIFEDIVVKSSNVGMGIIGERMGNRRLYTAVRRFGFGERTGIRLPGEGTGLVHPLDRWSAWSATSVPMGYELMVTPLQLARAFSAIANGGLLMRPHLVRYAYSPDGQLVTDLSEPVVVRRALQQKTADFMRRRVLRAVVERGTGRRAAVPGYRVFGKTGTAKKRDPLGRGYSDTLFVGSFIGGAPLENPRVVALVVVDEPDCSIGYYGGTVAAPAVMKILQRTLGYLQVPPDDPAQMARGWTVRHN